MAVDRYDDAPAMRGHALPGGRRHARRRRARPARRAAPPRLRRSRDRGRSGRNASTSTSARGFRWCPSARAANFTMDRRAIRDLAARELGLRTAPYRYAASRGELASAARVLGLPVVVKPLMSSSGKGQSVVRAETELDAAWEAAASGGRGEAGRRDRGGLRALRVRDHPAHRHPAGGADPLLPRPSATCRRGATTGSPGSPARSRRSASPRRRGWRGGSRRASAARASGASSSSSPRTASSSPSCPPARTTPAWSPSRGPRASTSSSFTPAPSWAFQFPRSRP